MKKTKNIMKKILMLFLIVYFNGYPSSNAQTLKYLFKTKLKCINEGNLPFTVYFAFDKNYILLDWDMVNEEFKLKDKIISYKKDKIVSKNVFINRLNGTGYKNTYGYEVKFKNCKTINKFPIIDVKQKF